MDTTAFIHLHDFCPAGATRPELEAAVGRYGEVEAWTVAGRSACLAAIDALDDDGVTAADVARARTKCSQRQAKRAAKTAGMLDQMPRHRDALVRGEISAEHVDAAADAAERTSPEQADAELVGAAMAQPADRFGKQSRQWAARHEDDAVIQTRHERQRAARTGAVYTRRRDQMLIVHLEFDAIGGQAIPGAIAARVDALWRADGGRHGTPDDVRTPEQRTADAIVELLTATSNHRATLNPNTRPHPKYLGVLRVDADRCTTVDPSGTAEFIDGTPLPQSVLERLACEAAWVGAVYNTAGAVLWQGRTHRLATDDQWTQLIARDGGCVCCGAPPNHCQAHHLTPWDPHGPSDITNLALVCNPTHHLIHDHHWTLHHDGTHIHDNTTWTLQPPNNNRAPPATAHAA